MHWLHLTGISDLLGLYVENLDKRLSDIDNMVAMHVSGSLKAQFLSFAARNDGKVATNSAQRKQLQQYYKVKSAAFMAAVVKTQQAYQQKIDSLRAAATARNEAYEQKVTAQEEKHFEEELALNQQSVFSQLGYTSPRPGPAPARVYAVSITTTGWHNIDMIAAITAEKRSDTIRMNGKSATITYQQVSFQVEGDYDRVFVYLLPDQLNSFIRVPFDDNRYSDQLNGLLKYNVMCIAYKGTQAFYYGAVDIQPGEHVISLVKTGDNALSMQINKYAGKRMKREIEEERKYLLQLSIYEQQENAEMARRKLYCVLMRILFPCWGYPQAVRATPTAPAPYSDMYMTYEPDEDQGNGIADDYYIQEYAPECNPKN